MKKALIFSLSLLLIACSSGTSTSNTDVSVEILDPDTEPVREKVDTSKIAINRTIEIISSDYAYDPSEIKLKKGERVKFHVIERGSKLYGINVGGTSMTINDVFVADAIGKIDFKCATNCEGEAADMQGLLIIE